MTHFHLAYYISSHGYGHARRSTLVVQALLRRFPEIRISLRTTAPAALFQELLGPRVERAEVALDPGAVERSPLAIDPAATLSAVRRALAERGTVVAAEAAALRESGCRLVVADIPFLAGEIAARAGVPCVGISNFTWDWIFEPLFAGLPGGTEALAQVRRGYGEFEALLRLPFGGVSPAVRRVVPVPLLGRRSAADPRAVLARIGVAAGDDRSRVLLGQRGGLPPEVLRRAAQGAPELLFLAPGAEGAPLPNVLPLPPAVGSSFSDLLAVSDIVLAKPGWGILADCIAAETALLWPPREGFREDAVALAEARPYLRQRRLPPERLHSGDWAADLRALLQEPPPEARPRLDGAEVSAGLLAEWLEAVGD
ncbi:MAG: hypothetical protein ACK47B_02955 [Armatimonadota bacterium]